MENILTAEYYKNNTSHRLNDAFLRPIMSPDKEDLLYKAQEAYYKNDFAVCNKLLDDLLGKEEVSEEYLLNKYN